MVYWTVAPASYPLIEELNNDPAFHAMLTPSGRQKLHRQRKDGSPQNLKAGIDYMIKEEVREDSDWVPLPKNAYTEEYRHDWILQRNRRPTDPTFAHCPMPRRGADTNERNAALTLTYFHPFTLNPDIADEHVPFLGNLCVAGMTWHASLLQWFDGRVLCQETKQYLDNFFAVTRARPEEDAGEHSDNNFSDEELDVGAHNFKDILKTRMGTGMERKPAEGENDNASPDDRVPSSTKEAFSSAHSMWHIPEDSAASTRPRGSDISEENLAKAFSAAASSQRKEFSGPPADGKTREPSLRATGGFTAKDVWMWYEKKKRQRTDTGELAVKAAQLEMLRIICQRVCDELQETPPSDPLLWLMHGGPGTGKSEVLKMAQELFREVCGWDMGMEYQMVALQAVMAQLLGGDTIHHALGINPFGQKSDPKSAQKASKRQTEVAQHVMQWFCRL